MKRSVVTLCGLVLFAACATRTSNSGQAQTPGQPPQQQYQPYPYQQQPYQYPARQPYAQQPYPQQQYQPQQYPQQQYPQQQPPAQPAAQQPSAPAQLTYAAGAVAIPGFFPTFLPPPPVPLPQLALGVARPVDSRALFSSPSATARSHCPRMEVVPGKWVTLDCGTQRPISSARAFIAPMGLGEQRLPLSVDHRTDGLDGPIKDQQEVGVCTAFSLSTAMDNAIRRLGKPDVTSPLHVWSRYRVPQIDKAGDSNLDKAITSESEWPYDPAKACRLSQHPDFDCEDAYHVQNDSVDSKLKAELARANKRGHFTLTSVESLHSEPGNPQEVAAIIAGGDSVWVAFKMSPNWQSFYLGRDAVIQDYQQTDDSGHAVVLIGYRTRNGVKQFLIHNSWGPNWGDHGYGWISENMVRDHMIYAYRVRVADAHPAAPAPQPAPGPAPRPAPSPAAPPSQPAPAPNRPAPAPPAPAAPLPPPAPAAPPSPSNGCPAGQVRDLVYGNCILPCPGGNAPSAGFCLPTLPAFQFPFALPGAAPTTPPPANQPSQPKAPAPTAPAPAAPAPNQPAPQQTRCPAGQAPDMFTGQCITYCPNGLPPIGGLCLPW